MKEHFTILINLTISIINLMYLCKIHRTSLRICVPIFVVSKYCIIWRIFVKISDTFCSDVAPFSLTIVTSHMCACIVFNASYSTAWTSPSCALINSVVPVFFDLPVLIAFCMGHHSFIWFKFFIFLVCNSEIWRWDLEFFMANRAASFLSSFFFTIKEVWSAVLAPNLKVLAKWAVDDLLVVVYLLHGHVH